ncbi:MAG: imidazolonepropionase-like amidohydrolase [Rhodothermales bacterium]|jgi:imidazolonepropionase-like amidohydrolase
MRALLPPTWLSCLLLALLSAPVHAQTTAFTNANVFDGVGETVLEGTTVVVRDGLIASIGGAVPADAKVIDLEGRFLLPGYIDAHVHIASIASLQRALESGVTTARSANTPQYQDVGLRDLVRAGRLPGPEILAAGTFVTPHPGDRALADPRLALLFDEVQTEEQIRQVVRINVERGADVIKTRGTERAGLPDTDPRKQVYTQEQLSWVVDEASKAGLPVLVHAHGDEGARAAVLAGARSIEHGTYLTDETLDLMKTRGTFLVPTYTVVTDLLEPGGDYDDPVLIIRAQHMLPNLERAIRSAHAKGIRIVASTDTGYDAQSLARVGTEMTHFVRLGMTPFEALQSATTVAADLLQVSDRTGRIVEGYEADLVVVAGNPLEDIRHVQDVVLVMSNGVLGMNRLPFGK